MSKLDEDIRKALLNGPSEEELKDLTAEKSYFSEIGMLFKGRNRWLSIGAYFEAFLFMGLFVYSVFGLVGATDDTWRALYLMMAILGFLVAVMIKLWLWIQMNRNATVREILRLELRLIEIQKSLGRD